MREILFRGKRVDNGEWVDGFVSIDDSNNTSVIHNRAAYHHVHTESVGQFTGLLDKNGKKIFEGDIVSVSYGKGIVEYTDPAGAFLISWIDDMEARLELLAFSNNGYRLGRSRSYELDKPIIIGNIHDNPELIK